MFLYSRLPALTVNSLLGRKGILSNKCYRLFGHFVSDEEMNVLNIFGIKNIKNSTSLMPLQNRLASLSLARFFMLGPVL